MPNARRSRLQVRHLLTVGAACLSVIGLSGCFNAITVTDAGRMGVTVDAAGRPVVLVMLCEKGRANVQLAEGRKESDPASQENVERGAWTTVRTFRGVEELSLARPGGLWDPRSGPGALDPDVLFVEDDRVVTSAGTAAGIDACLHHVRCELGAAVANRIARRMVVPPQREGGQRQFIDLPVPDCRAESLAPLLTWMREHLAEELEVDAAGIEEGTRFKEDLDADSLDLYELVMELEDTYGISVSEEQATKIATVGDAVEFVLEHAPA